MSAVKLFLAMSAAIILTVGMGATFAPEETIEITPVTYAKPSLIRALPPIAAPLPPLDHEFDEIPLEPEPVIEINARDAELIAQTMYGEYRGADKIQQAAVAWCILNRCDYYGQSVKEVVTAPHQFLGYSSDNPVLPELYDMAADVLTRHERERLGEADVGRVLPKEYMWFGGNGTVNVFRDAYEGGNRWEGRAA